MKEPEESSLSRKIERREDGTYTVLGDSDHTLLDLELEEQLFYLERAEGPVTLENWPDRYARAKQKQRNYRKKCRQAEKLEIEGKAAAQRLKFDSTGDPKARRMRNFLFRGSFTEEDRAKLEARHEELMALLVNLKAADGCQAGRKQENVANLEEMEHLATIEQQWYQKSSQLMVYNGKVGRCPARILIDGGASASVIGQPFVDKNRLKTKAVDDGPTFRLPDGSTYHCTRVLDSALISIQDYQERISPIFVLPTSCPFDVILGKPWLDFVNPDIDWPKNTMSFSRNGTDYFLSAALDDPVACKECGIISAMEFAREYQQGAECYFICVMPQSDGELSEDPSASVDCELRDLETKLKADFADVMPAELPDELPPERFVDHHIELTPGAQPVAGAMYRHSILESQELKRQLQQLLEKGFIQPSKSPFGAPVLFVKKKTGDLRMCIDFRALNQITIKNRTPLPRIDDLLESLSGAKYFTCLDLRSGYYQIRIAPEDIEKTAFRTKYGHFEFKVLPFGLTNAPATFQTLMNHVFSDMLDVSVLVYLDDIMIFSKTLEEHKEHVAAVLKRLRKHKLYLNGPKCKFFRTKVDWLGHVVSSDGISVDQSKIQAVLEWPRPENVTVLQSFLGYAGYYRRFVRAYSEIARPLTDLLKKFDSAGKKVEFVWTEACQIAFEVLKKRLTEAPVLLMPSPDYPFMLFTDASHFAMGGVLMQDQGDGPRPVGYFSRKFSRAELNYDAYEKEALALLSCLDYYRHLINGAPTTMVFTDNQALTTLKTQAKINGRQARWLLRLAEYDTDIKYLPGKANVVADALSRRPDHFVATIAVVATVQHVMQDKDWFESLLQSYAGNDEVQNIIKNIQDGTAVDYQLLGPYLVRNKESVGHPQIFVPDAGSFRQQVLAAHHDTLFAGHFGANKTAESILRHYYWPSLHRDVKHYVQSCPQCSVSKASTKKPTGLLQPISVEKRFDTLHMDFVSGLPPINGFDCILVMVEKFTKTLMLAATTTTCDAAQAFDLYLQHAFPRIGVPNRIITDRGTQFNSHFTKAMNEYFKIKQNMSTAYHPQTDGQAERAVRTVVETLRCFITEYPDWVKALPVIEFAYNTSTNPSTGKSPSELLYGENLPTPASLDVQKILSHAVNPAAANKAAEIHKFLDAAKAQLAQAQHRQMHYANTSRSDLSFEVGQAVMLSTDKLRIPERYKTHALWYGPLFITEKIGPLAYKLELPPDWKIHNVFHVSRLKAMPHSEQYPRPFHNPLPAVEPPDQGDGNVEKILAVRVQPWGRTLRRYYLIKWENYSDADNTWEPRTHLWNNSGPKVKDMIRKADQELEPQLS